LPPVPVAARLPSIERAVQPVISATILLFVLASGSIQSWIPLARRLRWLALLGLLVLAVALRLAFDLFVRPPNLYSLGVEG
jgi:hypothetical protein